VKDTLDEDRALAQASLPRDVDALLALFAPSSSLVLSASGSVPGLPPVPGLILRPARVAGGYSRWGKRVLDLVFVVLTAPLSLSIVGLCALALWIEGGNPFYRQDRIGAGGRVFSIVKLRTMVRDADAILQHYLDADPALRLEWATTQKLKRDPRITRVGAVLRSTSLDELPQFWNVLTGEMSLVGPRPMLPEQLDLYGAAGDYFALRPGITGFWQVSARNESHFSFRAEIDAQYRRRVSLWCDLGVMLRTVGVMVRRTGY
jgi:lipopolysaccharide/colanic/teichoic acid biosynthesis glycosyltransferase